MQVRLLAVMAQGKQLVVGQAQMERKSNEIPAFYALLDGLEERGVKRDGVVLIRRPAHPTRAGHGRLETRVVQVLTVTDLGVDFPHSAQAAKIARCRTPARTGRDP